MLPEIACLVCSFVHGELLKQFLRACSSGDERSVRWLWRRKLITLEDIRTHNNLGLPYACCAGHESIGKFIWSLAAPVKPESHLAYFRDACYCGHLSTARWLWDLGLTLEQLRENNRDSALALACYQGHEHIVRWLWSLGMTLDDVRQENNRALAWASQKGHESIVKFLVGLGLTLQDIRSGDAFQMACRHGYAQTARWLFSLGLTLNDVRRGDCQALGDACWNGHENLAHWLLDLGLTLHDIGGQTFYQACLGRLHSVVVRMWNMGLHPADIAQFDVFGDLCEMGSFETCHWLWSRGVRGNLKEAFKRSCLREHNLQVCEWLWSLGARLSILDLYTLYNYNATGPLKDWLWERLLDAF